MLAAQSKALEPYKEVGFMALTASAFPISYLNVLGIVKPYQNT